MARQNYYKARRVRQRREVDEQLIVEMVRSERQVQPRLGGKKLYRLLRDDLAKAGVMIGRDRLMEVLRNNDFLVPRLPRVARTTFSGHGLFMYPNLVKDLVLGGPHQVLVSDITYIRTDQGFLYLVLVMDAWSRAIVGYDCSDSLEAVGVRRALSMALRQLPAGSTAIHHSDRGSQYCCHETVELLEDAGVGISMTEENHCYENAQAERLNGILKQEYGLGGTFRRKSDVKSCVAQAVHLYNYCRPHQSLGYEFPMRVHTAA